MPSYRLLAPALMALAAFAFQPAFAQNKSDYLVAVGDQVEVSVYGKPELSGSFRVRGDGTIVLHLLGPIPVAGATFSEIEGEIVARAQEQFGSRESALVDITTFRDVYVLGTVQNPGAYEYIPGLNVVKAIALAGGYETLAEESTSTERDIDATRRRVLEAQNRLRFAQTELAAIERELARLDGVEVADLNASEDDLASDQVQLITLRRTLSERFTEGAERRRSLAIDEASLFEERRTLVDEQLAATEEQYTRVNDLVERGLARREQLLEVQVDLNDLRADALEAAAFEARARQTAANAESDYSVEQTQYRHALLRDKILVEERAAVERAELEASLAFLRELSPDAAQELGTEILSTIYEIYRSGEDAPERGTLSSPLGPDDTLIVRFEAAAN